MKARCSNKNNVRYHNYGGRGIKVCDEWQEFIPFMNWAITHGYTDELTLDRINNDGNYEPSNCRWATNMEQQNNKKNTLYSWEVESWQVAYTLIALLANSMLLVYQSS